MEQYLGWDAVSAGVLKDVTERSVRYADWHRRHDDGGTRYTERGTAIHTAILEPHVFESRYGALPRGCNLTTREGRAAKALIVRSGRTALKAEDYDACRYLRDNVLAHPQASALVLGGECEVSMLWQDRHGPWCKARPDVLHVDASIIVDVKSTTDASERQFARHAARMGYHRSAPHYIDGAEANGVPIRDWLMLACEAEPPYDVALYSLDPVLVDRARLLNEKAMRKWALAENAGEYAGYSHGVVPLAFPDWAYRQGDEA